MVMVLTIHIMYISHLKEFRSFEMISLDPKLIYYHMSIRLITTIGFLFLLLALHAQTEFDVYDYWSRYPDPRNNMYRQLVDEAQDLDVTRKSIISKLETKDDWISYQALVKEKLAKLIGPFPEKTPLNPVITETLDGSKYTVEKLYFESRPGFIVTAAMFIPKNIALPAATILFCSGHSSEGFRSPTYQHMILNYVQKGFIVLAFDPVGQGERYQYFNEHDETYLSPTREHSYPGNQIFVNGVSPANYFVWDGMRAIDYLTSRPEVDPNRLGVTGRSGGGTQTAYLMALDDRVTAAAPECYLTSYSKLLRSIGPQDAEQIIFHFLQNNLDLGDLVVARFPKPTLMVTTTRDIFSIQGARDLFQETRECFELSGAAGNFQMVEDDAGHASTKKNREATYAFFQKHLSNPGSAQDQPVDTFSIEDLWITQSGQAIKELNSETLYSLNKEVALNIENSIRKNPIKEEDWSNLRDKIRIQIGYQLKEDPVTAIYSGAVSLNNVGIEKYLLDVGDGTLLPFVWMKPENSHGAIKLILDERGKGAQKDSSSLAWQLVRDGHEVALVDLSGIGELGGGYSGGDATMQGVPVNVWYAGILVHRSPLGIRVEEIRQTKSFIEKRKATSQKIDVISVGTLGSDVLHAAALGVDFNSTMLIDHLTSYRSLLFTDKYQVKYILSSVAGSFPIYDLPHLAHYVKNELVLLNPKNAKEQDMDPSKTEDMYRKFRRNKKNRSTFSRRK